MPSLIGGSLANKKWSMFQIGDTAYFHNPTNGFRKYAGVSLSTITPAAEAPAAPTFNANLAGSLTVSTTYQWKLTFVNPSLGIESEPSTALSRALGGAETGVTLNLPAITAPYTAIRIYRTVSNGQSLFLEGETTALTYNSTASDSRLGISVDTTIDVLTTIPVGNWAFDYKGTPMVVQDTAVRFCHLAASDSDQYWLETDKFNISGKYGKLKGGAVVGDTALIFSSTSIHAIQGESALDYTLSRVRAGLGIISTQTVDITPEGDLLGFSGKNGVIIIRENDLRRISETGQIVDVKQLSSPSLDPIFQGIDDTYKLNPTEYENATGYIDAHEKAYHLFVSDYEFVFDLESGSWYVTPNVKAKSSVFVQTGNQHSAGYYADNRGFLVRGDISYTNLVPNGTVSGKPTSSTRTTLTDSLATFDTLGDGLKGAFLVIDHDTYIEVRQIISNTATAITVDAPFDIIPSTIDNYYIGYIQVRLMTKQYHLSENTNEKFKNQYVGLFHEQSEEDQNLTIKTFLDGSDIATGGDVINLTTRVYDKVKLSSRSQLIQVYMFSQYNKQKSRFTTPVNISSYLFLSDPKGEV